MSPAAVLAQGLHVRFGDVEALAGIDLVVASGTTVAVLGHNGAGKTTLIGALTTLVRPSAGRVEIDGFDATVRGDEVRRRIGVTGQYAGLDDYLTGREHLEMLARLTADTDADADRAEVRAQDLIDRMELAEIADRRVGALSGGSRRRIDLAASLVGDPSVLFLDEPTTGLDPIARTRLWDVVDDLNDRGTTVVLTTQYLDEADRLADEIVVLDHGRVVATGAPADLKRLVGGKVVTATVPTDQLGRLSDDPHDRQPVAEDLTRIVYSTSDAGRASAHVARLVADGIDVIDVDIASPNLDDVLVHLTRTATDDRSEQIGALL